MGSRAPQLSSLQQGQQSLLQLTRPEDAAASGEAAVKHAAGAKDEDMPDDFCACMQPYQPATGCLFRTP
eukprot:CAMPEP_0184288152 /NCGR_PEP_ID=MMETSP1049-20130417/655_1 /TAXON_ID=77928 /ORGANISM="Proteomonas sulcata, Strain CCMP704" /LENGTH=68 /DNA_ID=CAMNT_0026594379 /DNA_START=282 /DNA_END=489 /DNA_ORIENTATION=-